MSDKLRELIARITDCLAKGGLFNMEVMEAGKVRDLLIECRTELEAAFAAAPSIEPAQREALPVERTRKALENAIQCIMENIDCSGTEFSAEIDGVEEYHQVIWWVEQWQAALAAPAGKSEGL